MTEYGRIEGTVEVCDRHRIDGLQRTNTHNALLAARETPAKKACALLCAFRLGCYSGRRTEARRTDSGQGGTWRGGLGVINYGEDSSPNLSASAPRLVVTELGKVCGR
jgi:hypothetical protein